MDTLKKCLGAGCPLKETCTRYAKEVNFLSGDFRTTPFNNYLNNCKYYMAVPLKMPIMTKALFDIEWDNSEERKLRPIEDYEKRRAELKEYLKYSIDFFESHTHKSVKRIETKIGQLNFIIDAKSGNDQPVQ